MTSLIECVPNISEGRRPEVIGRIADALKHVPGAALLDVSSDPDHNRTVLTLVGSPAGVTQAIRTLFSDAIELIDLRDHLGCHPRMGGVDVVPIIPIRGVTMQECVEISRSIAGMISGEFNIPTYLYANSATEDNRRTLSKIREGGFEGLTSKMQLPKWKPDFGKSQAHPSAGVTAVGARFFLIAYNIQLGTPDIHIADSIARTIRASSGGLPFVQAMGVYLRERNQAQVSMNLLDYRVTSMRGVFDAVEAEATKHSVNIVSSEIVGLVPRAALVDSAPEYLKIENWRDELILENAISSVQPELAA